MFRFQDILKRLHEKPFQPFRIMASEGLHYDIYHPDLVLVGERDLMIGTPSSMYSSAYDGVVRVALLHVVALQDLPASGSSTDGVA